MVYYSRKILLIEQNYDIINKKLLIIMVTLKKWYMYIEGVIEIIVYIDYKNLLLFIIMKEFNRR